MGRFNEYYGGAAPTARQTGALGAVKLKNQIKAIDPSLVLSIKNISVNGSPQGCSGFISTPDGSKHVYVCADRNHGTSSTAYYRTAQHVRDYTGGRNHDAEYHELAQLAVALLKEQ
jgi:hypothetical protein